MRKLLWLCSTINFLVTWKMMIMIYFLWCSTLQNDGVPLWEKLLMIRGDVLNVLTNEPFPNTSPNRKAGGLFWFGSFILAQETWALKYGRDSWGIDLKSLWFCWIPSPVPQFCLVSSPGKNGELLDVHPPIRMLSHVSWPIPTCVWSHLTTQHPQCCSLGNNGVCAQH